MGFFGNLISATVKTVLTPIAVAKDVINVVTDDEIDTTKNLVNSIKKDIEKAGDDLAEGEL